TEAAGKPELRLSTFLYDAVGNLRSQPVGLAPQGAKDPGLDVTKAASVSYYHPERTDYGYDVLNRRISVTAAAGRPEATLTTLAYDAAGNRVALTRGLSNNSYDGQGNLVPSAPDLRPYSHPETTTYRYDALNRQVARTDDVPGPAGTPARTVLT